jgi:hypothetical protein
MTAAAGLHGTTEAAGLSDDGGLRWDCTMASIGRSDWPQSKVAGDGGGTGASSRLEVFWPKATAMMRVNFWNTGEL